MMRFSTVFSLFLCLGLFLASGCGGGEKGEDLAKEFNATMKAQVDEIAAAKDPAKSTEIMAKHKAKLEAINAKVAKLSDAEKKIFVEKTLLAGMPTLPK